MDVVVDACVIVAAAKPSEPHHVGSVDFLTRLSHPNHVAIMPATMLWEVGTALAHPDKSPAGVRWASPEDLSAVTFEFVPVDEAFFVAAWEGSLRLATNALDRIVLALARSRDATLATWDQQLVSLARRLGIRADSPSGIDLGPT